MVKGSQRMRLIPKEKVPEFKKIFPVDESCLDSSFKEFRGQLIEAIVKKDSEFILNVTDPDIRYSFGMNEGIEGFKKRWNIESPSRGGGRSFRGEAVNPLNPANPMSSSRVISRRTRLFL